MAEPAEELVAHRSWLRRIALRMVRSNAAADDLVQETCVAALSRAPTGTHMRPWLLGVMRMLAHRHFRSERRRAWREERFQRAQPAISAPDGLLDYGVRRERLTELLGGLPEPFRSTVLLRFMDGLSCAEIARAENVPPGTVRWRLSRALELLRIELEAGAGGRRSGRHVVHLWPLGALGENLIARDPVRSIGYARRATIWLTAAAALAIGVALWRSSAPVDRLPPAARNDAEASFRASRFSAEETLQAATYGIPPAGAGPIRTARAPETSLAGAIARREDGGRDERSRQRLSRLEEEYELALYDCEIDRDSVLRCHRHAFALERAVHGTCQLLVRSVRALERNGGRPVRSPHSSSFLGAALLANLSVAARLGCAIVTEKERDESPDDLEPVWGSGPEGAEPVCVTQDGSDGADCATCTDEGGSRTACGPVRCQTTAGPDGAVCMSCVDADGRSETTCAGGQWESDCDSALREFGLLCSTCAGDTEPECLVAKCSVKNRCLECTDPKGRVGVDCSIDYEVLPTASFTGSSGDTFHTCTASYGYPGGATGVCHYPGPSTCTARPQVGCLDCEYPDGSGKGVCYGDADHPLPDPTVGRPSTLPPPGTCVTETVEDGRVQCSTCTRYDLSAEKACRFPPASVCFGTGGANSMEYCLRCTLRAGGSVRMCDEGGR